MAQMLSRRAFLRARIAGSTPAIRPPWAVEEQRFLSLCSRCDECRNGCPEQIIHKGDGGFPAVDFSRGECIFCGECVTQCTSGALSVQAMQSELPAWTHTPSINVHCLALNRVVCRSCAEQCEPQAIRFRPAPGGVSRPELNPEQCNGCGACVAPCPVAAIELNSSGTAGAQKQENNP